MGREQALADRRILIESGTERVVLADFGLVRNVGKLKSSDTLPRGKWVEILPLVDLSWHTVSGQWHREKRSLVADPQPLSRTMLPIEINGDYDLSAEFTRTHGDNSITVMIPVGQRTCQLTLAGGRPAVHGLDLIDGRSVCEPENPAVFRPGSLVNDRRYRVLISVRMKDRAATVRVWLDRQLLITWEGKQSSLGIAPVWQLPYRQRAGLGSDDGSVTFHAASFRSVSGTAKLASLPAAPFEQAPGEAWSNLLADVDLDRDTIHGDWCRLKDGIAVAAAAAEEPAVRLMLTATVEGSYNLVAEFTRTRGGDSAAVTLPVGTRACTLHFSAFGGQVSGLDRIDGKGLADPSDPAIRRPGGLVNGHRYTALVSVQLLPCPRLDDHDVLIDVWLDGRPLLRWSGRESSLGLDPVWSVPERRHIAIGGNRSLVVFHSLRLKKSVDR